MKAEFHPMPSVQSLASAFTITTVVLGFLCLQLMKAEFHPMPSVQRLASAFTITTVVLGFLCHDAIACPIAKTNCPDKCGNVSVPYPFGIGEGCYKDRWFEITCMKGFSADGPVPVLRVYQLKVSKLVFHKVRVLHAWDFPNCHPNEDTGMELLIKPQHYDRGTYNPFYISPDLNTLIGEGCGIFTYVSNIQASIFTGGCFSLCLNQTKFGIPPSDYYHPRKCLGFECCEAAVPSGLKSLSVRMFSTDVSYTDLAERMFGFGNSSDHQNPPRCSRAFIAEKTFLRSKNEDREIPMVLSWVLGNETCNTSSIGDCGTNAHCIDFADQGRRCKCNTGFEGNPYLPQGCVGTMSVLNFLELKVPSPHFILQKEITIKWPISSPRSCNHSLTITFAGFISDINECNGTNKRCTGVQNSVCINTEGGFYCSCQAGYKLAKGFVGNHCIRDATTIDIVISGLGIGLTALITLAFGIWSALVFRRMRRAKLKKAFFKRNGGLLFQQIASQEGTIVKTEIFTSEELERATDNFSESRTCGKGGSGTVYKGMLSDGRIVAIKKSHLMHQKQVDQFINEVVILSEINHRNVVKLLGCCLETEVPLLVYEFVNNGTLSQHLHGGDYSSCISWTVRINIALEIAGALAYLHSATSMPIFHRDVKSSNVLLDNNYGAKISDFGISRSISLEKTHLTTGLQGTFGYLDPEYFHSRQFTDKSDVYSFGVVLLELLTGERAVSRSKVEVEDKSLVLNFIRAMKEDRLHDILDDRIRHELTDEELLGYARLAKRCLKLNGKKRPAMKEVAMDLEKISRPSSLFSPC